MIELLRSLKTCDFIPASPVSLLFLPGPNLSVSRRQACAVSLHNAAPRSALRDGLTLPSTFKLP